MLHVFKKHIIIPFKVTVWHYRKFWNLDLAYYRIKHKGMWYILFIIYMHINMLTRPHDTLYGVFWYVAKSECANKRLRIVTLKFNCVNRALKRSNVCYLTATLRVLAWSQVFILSTRPQYRSAALWSVHVSTG